MPNRDLRRIRGLRCLRGTKIIRLEVVLTPRIEESQ
jgi:hypothetical protein